MTLQQQESNKNFKAFIWHAAFLALAANFMDIDTVIPAMLLSVGGNAIHLGILTSIMVGGASFMQLFFSGMLSNIAYKKKFLLAAINLRVLSLLGLSTLFYFSKSIDPNIVLLTIFGLILIFSFSGSFANISYIDILGKTITKAKRKKFFSLKQFISSIGLLISAFGASYVLKQYVFPENYSVTFIFAASLLFIASGGFYFLSEKTPSAKKRMNLKNFFAQMPKEIKLNKNLKNYLFIINMLGIGVSLLPFVILLAKDSGSISLESIGSFIIFRTLGMAIGSISLFYKAKSFKYKNVLLFNVFLGSALPIIALALQNNAVLFPGIFLLAGVFVSTYKVAMNGILIEISNDENRTLYAGISGAGNILTSIFPIIAGILLASLGYNIVFGFISLIMFASIFFIRKLRC
ncbi:MAG: MFS transporter [Bacteroidetes bacterium]|nr:MAG: MFS transporter [Bacteroidota bacterium]